MSGFRTALRAACVSLLEDYKDSLNVGPPSKPFTLQIYPGRPRSINPPTAFIDRIYETIVYTGPELVQRSPRADVIVLFGEFDSKEAVDQADAFADGFIDFVTARVHEAGDNTTVGLVDVEDNPTFVNDWRPPQEQRTYFGTRCTLEGYSET